MNPLLIIIPAYNEEACIAGVVGNVINNYPQYDYVVVNDGSSDATEKICRQNGYNCLSLPVNLGLASAFQTGMRYAFENDYEMAVQLDGDGQHDPADIAGMVEKMEQEKLDIVLGSRFYNRSKPVSMRMAGSVLIQLSVRLSTGKRMSDPTCGMRLYDRAMIKEFAGKINYAPEPDTISFLIRKGVRFGEAPIMSIERKGGVSYLNFWHSMFYMIKMSLSILIIQWFRKR